MRNATDAPFRIGTKTPARIGIAVNGTRAELSRRSPRPRFLRPWPDTGADVTGGPSHVTDPPARAVAVSVCDAAREHPKMEPRAERSLCADTPARQSGLPRDGGTVLSDDLTKEQVQMLRKAFDMFDRDKKGYVHTNMVSAILRTLGQTFEEKDLKELISEIDQDGSGELEFDEFVALAARFLVEEDTEAMQEELREAFRLYDKEGNGYINVSDLREILRALDDALTEDELDEMIAEIDTDGSGTVDFDDYSTQRRAEPSSTGQERQRIELRALDGQRSLPPEVRSKIKVNPIPKHMSHELHEGRHKARIDRQRRQFKGNPYVTYVLDVAAYPATGLFTVAAVIQHQTIKYDVLPLSPLSKHRLSLVKRKILVLDLDETLIHSHHDGVIRQMVKPGTPPDFVLKVTIDRHPVRFFVHKRPHVDYFLDVVSQWYELVVFTASMEIYGAAVADKLDNNRGILRKRYYRQHCTLDYGSYTKDLSAITQDLSSIFILDNSPGAYRSYPDNAIPIKSWFSDPRDMALLNLLPVLDALRFTSDVRSVLSRNLHLHNMW
ncbi:hypothetical protein HPB49_001865 [Dermacentor silvarum]|uniref:Uncharacterized protein n=1 Tax=Dermacentor silvarum TaxID=543639 RepID=A0ACB8D1P2_DERSI|nr:hypothetical protein HPB49_001865 [Dermacentor silvarum]